MVVRFKLVSTNLISNLRHINSLRFWLSVFLLLYGRGRNYTSFKRVFNLLIKTQEKKQKQVKAYVSRCIFIFIRNTIINI